MSTELLSFIKEALAKGLDRTEIRKALLEAKWNSEEVDASLQRFSSVTFPVPVPAPKASVSAREAFEYLVLFVTLYLTAFSIGSLWFAFINRHVPDELYAMIWAYDTSSIRQASATLLIAAPLFFWLSKRVRVRLARHPEEQQSGVRRWLTYLTLFIAASIIIGTLITLVVNVLSGELTWRFFLKVLTVLVITGSIFGYYLWDLRRDEVEELRPLPRLRLRAFTTIVLLITAATLAGGLFLSGSPAQERLRRLDEQHIQTLQQVSYSIEAYAQQHATVPPTIQELWNAHDPIENGSLPGTVAAIPDFAYHTTASTSYELCASFALPSEPTTDPRIAPSTPIDSATYPTWNHPAGLTCFPRIIRPILK